MALGQLIAFLNTAHADLARTFYQDTLGIPLTSESPYALVFECQGVMLRVAKAPPFEPLPFTVLGFHVENIEAECERLTGVGITFERYTQFEQDALGVWSSPGGAKVAWFKDPDGNLLSLTEFAPVTADT